jgi:hypothetical protein
MAGGRQEKRFVQAWFFYASTVAFFNFFFKMYLILFTSLVYREKNVNFL